MTRVTRGGGHCACAPWLRGSFVLTGQRLTVLTSVTAQHVSQKMPRTLTRLTVTKEPELEREAK